MVVEDSEAVKQGGAVAVQNYEALEKIGAASLGVLSDVQGVAFSPDGSRIVSGDASGKVILWDAGALTQLHTASSGGGDVLSVAFSPDGSRIVSGDIWGPVTMWDADNLTQLHTANSCSSIYSVAFSPDGSRIVSGDRSG